MSGVERPDWDGTEPPAQAERTDGGRVVRPDWTEPDVRTSFNMGVSKSEPRPDWPLEPAEPETLDAEPEDAEPVVDTPAEQTADSVLETMIAELAETGEHDLEIAHEVVQATLETIPIADRAGFQAGFDGLPPGAQKAIVGELASPRNEWEGMADDDELANFSSTPEGAELVALWDDDADTNLARVQARLSRIEANTSPAAIETMWDWFDSLPSAQAKAVLQVLAE